MDWENFYSRKAWAVTASNWFQQSVELDRKKSQEIRLKQLGNFQTICFKRTLTMYRENLVEITEDFRIYSGLFLSKESQESGRSTDGKASRENAM